MDEIKAVVGEIVKPEDEINEEHKLAVQAGENMLEHAIHCGELLLAQKARMDHGDFMPWIQEHCTFSYRQAAKYMQIVPNVPREAVFPHEDDGTPKTLPDLGGSTSIAQALRTITAENKEKKAVEVTKPKEVPFSWMRVTSVVEMFDAMKSYVNVLRNLAKDGRDPEFAYYLLSTAAQSFQKLADYANALLGSKPVAAREDGPKPVEIIDE